MQKSRGLKLALTLLTLPCILMGCSKGKDILDDNAEENEFVERTGENMRRLLTDTNFKGGFNLLTTKTTNGRNLSGVLNYEGKAVGEPSWEMAQWWAPDEFDFINADFNEPSDGVYDYRGQSRHCLIDTNKNEITLDQNSWLEYQTLYGHSRNGSENWSHFLLEQNFKEPAKMVELEHVYVHLEFILNKSTNMDEGQPIPCAQISWYFTVTDVKNGNSQYESGDNDFYWFGLPLYDSRFDFVDDYHHVDSGFVGATNKLIYSVGSRNFLPEKIQIGKKYIIDVDILPWLKQAYNYGLMNGAMQNSNVQDLFLNYMNIGWELPGSYDVSITLKNLSVVVENKERK